LTLTSRRGRLDRVQHAMARDCVFKGGAEMRSLAMRAHATLMRRLEVDLVQATGLALADFDVLAQLARAGGELRMTDLAARALISRSGMTRRVARLAEEGLVRRTNADADARGVVVALTDAGVARLTATAPVHLREISELFVTPLDEVAPGLWRFTVNRNGIPATMTAYALRDGEDTILVDPLVVGETEPLPEALDEIVQGRVRILVTTPFHLRGSELLWRRMKR
jgi:DNA-binding MarR family transcriptional regulator